MGLLGRKSAAASPTIAMAPKAIMASAYDRSGDVRPDTRMVPATAVPRDEPRLDTLRERPEISPCRSSAKLDCTTFTEGVNITPSPRPMSRRPGAKAETLGDPFTRRR